MKSRSLTVLISLLSLVLLAPLVPGCGGDSAPVPSEKPQAQVQKEQEDIMRKEYGPGVDKAKKH